MQAGGELEDRERHHQPGPQGGEHRQGTTPREEHGNHADEPEDHQVAPREQVEHRDPADLPGREQRSVHRGRLRDADSERAQHRDTLRMYILQRRLVEEATHGGLDAVLVDQHPVVQHADGGAHLRDLGEQVGVHEDGDAAFLVEPPHGVPELTHTQRVQARGGLVEEEDLGVVEDRLGDPDPLPHARREAAEPSVGVPIGGDEPQRLRGSRPRLGHPRESSEELQVLPGGQIPVEANLGRQVPDTVHNRAPLLDDIEPTHPGAPLVGAISVVRMLMAVVLPAPWWPRKPKTSARSIERSMPWCTSLPS